jgi:S-formylglutathione hydrolase FrmB
VFQCTFVKFESGFNVHMFSLSKKYVFLSFYLFSFLLNAQTINVTIEAPSLIGSKLGTSTERSIQVYLPPLYNSSKQHYPVVYFLAGYGAKANEYEPLHKRIDELANSGKIDEMIFVFVDGFDPLLGSFYVNSELHGNWETFISKDLVQYVDTHYRTNPNSQNRGISGHSMGGFGSIHIGQNNQSVFGGIYALSPAIFAPKGFNSSFLANNWQAITGFNNFTNFLRGKSKEERRKLFDKRVKTINQNDNQDYDGFYETFLYAYGGAFSPINEAPFSIHPSISGSAVFSKWQDGFGGVVSNLLKHAESNRSQKVRVDYGTDDQFQFIRDGGKYLSDNITNEDKVKVTAFKGGHGNKLEERFVEFVLPFFNEQFSNNGINQAMDRKAD